MRSKYTSVLDMPFHNKKLRIFSFFFIDDLEAEIASMMYQIEESKAWVCSVCEKESRGKTDITRHIEAIHIENHPGYPCPLCSSVSKSRDTLRKHVSRVHPEIRHNKQNVFLNV